MKIKFPYVLIACIVVMGIYLNTLDNAPTNWDDPAIFTNPYLRGLTVENLAHALTFQTNTSFQPLRDISYMIDFSLWRTTPGLILGLHLHNILLYLGMVIACFAFLLLLFRAFDMHPEQARFLAGIASLVYAVHPVHVESVAWLYARKEPLLGLFSFVCLAAFLKARLDRQWPYVVLSALALHLAILAKPTAVVLPAVILVMDILLRLKRGEPIPWVKGMIFLLPLAAFALWQAVRLIDMLQASGGILPYHGGSFATNLLAVSQIFVAYGKLIGFTPTYAADYPLRLYLSLHQWQAWVFLFLNAAVIASAVLALMKGRHLYLFSVFWYYIFLLPVSNIFPISQVLADRYALLPSLSWCLLLGYVLTRLRYATMPASGPLISPAFPTLLAYGLTFALLAGYAAMTVRQNDVWQDSQTLWEHAVAYHPTSFPANINLSMLYLNQKRYSEAERLCINALANLPQANLFGAAHMALNNLSTAQMNLGDYKSAISNYEQVLKRDPVLPQARLGLAHCFWQMKDYGRAFDQYRFILAHVSIAIPRVKAEILYRTGYSAWKLGRTDEAQGYLDQAANPDPANPSLLRQLSGVHTSMGLPEKAHALLKQAGAR